MQDHMRPEIEKSTKKQFPNGIESYGADALRFTFASLATTGRDIRFDIGRIEGYKNFCNKLWNAAHFVLLNTNDLDIKDEKTIRYSIADKWIISLLNQTTKTVHEHFSNYRFDLAAQCLHEFVWHEFCDWYLELAKATLQNEHNDCNLKLGTKTTLTKSLESILRLLHPIMPFITEEIWINIKSKLALTEETIMLRSYPKYCPRKYNINAEKEITWIKQFIAGVRQIRGEMDISPGKKLPILLQNSSRSDKTLVNDHLDLLKRIGRIETIHFLMGDEKAPTSSTAMHGKMKLLIPLADLIDIDDEIARLTKKIIHARNEIIKNEVKLNNENFLKNAPPEVVSNENKRMTENKLLIKDLESQIDKLQKITTK
jgi:valyl-tRNA synthetase